jgi:hypothetical protein
MRLDDDDKADAERDEERAPASKVITIDDSSAPLKRVGLNETEKYYVQGLAITYKSLQDLVTNLWLQSDVIALSCFIIFIM